MLDIDTMQQDDTYVKAIPAELLKSLKVAHPTTPLSTRLGPLKRLITQSPELRTLHYEDRGQGTSFAFQGDERMPPLHHLTLRSYDWQHSREEVARHWDFSQLKVLQIVSVPSYNFLTSVNPCDLGNLRVLRVDDFSAHLPDRRREATWHVANMLSTYIRSLDTLDLVCDVATFSLDSVLQHRNSLLVLCLRDHTGFGEDDHRCPTLQARELSMLAAQLSVLHTLELDMDIQLCEPAAFLRAICHFPKLRTLTLHVQTVLGPLDSVHPETDRDFEATVQTFEFLWEHKQQSLQTCGWKRITINIGGWRRVMVRRVSSTWRERNERGIFAERCFVLEADEAGQPGIREEISVESTSNKVTPEI